MGGETNRTMAPTSSAHYSKLAQRPVGKQIHGLYVDRLNQMSNSAQYSSQFLNSKRYNGRLSGDDHVKLSVWSAPDLSRPTFEEATSSKNEYRKAHKGDSFGPSWSTHWFKVQYTVPSDWKGKPVVELHWDSNSEAMIWTSDGKPLQGLTGGGERNEWLISEDDRHYDKEQMIYIEIACNGMFGNPTGGDIIQPPDPNRSFQLVTADLVSVNPDARALHYDFWIIGDAAREFPQDSWQEHQALQVCNDIMDCFIAGSGSDECLKECRKIAKRYLDSDVDSEKVYENNTEGTIVNAIGNCHIDTCWLWPWAETKRKVARSWSNQCGLLDRYPEHRFVASQAQQFKWLEKLYPSAFDRVKSHIKEGRFQTIGGSWVEHDTNMPSGESLVRQFLYGQRFFESRFGERCKTFWLPDTFGYSTQLPQLCRLAGMNRFFTQKLSWNNINNFPHTTFNWVSLDGSQVICHMAPCETYTSDAHFGDVKRSVSQHKSMDQDATSLLPFGKGDGGGGPTYEHLEKLRRCRAMANKVGMLPKVKIVDSVETFFDSLESRSAKGELDLVTWYGELYFELHRGTYTTQANNKRNNRKAEILLHDIEYLATLATIDGEKGYKYPKKELDEMWEGVLLCQFHDCLPGSAIEMCYRDSDELYAKAFKTGQTILKDALSALGFGEETKHDSAIAANRPDLHGIVVETLGWNRERPAALALKAIQQTHLWDEDDSCPDDWESCEPGTPSWNFLTSETLMVRERKEDGVFFLSNPQLEVQVKDGVIVSLFDKKAKREVIPKGEKANQLVIFDDHPLYWQAWDVEVFHLRSRQELKASQGSTMITEDEPERVAVSTTVKISEESWIKTTISLNAVPTGEDAPLSRVEVDAEVEWHESMKFLKVEFPTTITNTEASYETQYGIIRRPTHYNTSWDMAKFEVCCHKWADLSEHGYGLSILNESKYGFATAGNLMRLSLLRSPKAPDAHADMGRHHIRWAMLPHAGPLNEQTVRAGFEFNYPMRLHKHPKPEAAANLMSAFKMLPGSSPSLILDAVKRGEDDADVSNGDMPAKKGKHVILRVYDSLGGLSRGTIGLGPVKVSKAWKCNLLEDELEELKISKEGLDIELRAFEVASYKLLLA